MKKNYVFFEYREMYVLHTKPLEPKGHRWTVISQKKDKLYVAPVGRYRIQITINKDSERTFLSSIWPILKQKLSRNEIMFIWITHKGDTDVSGISDQRNAE